MPRPRIFARFAGTAVALSKETGYSTTKFQANHRAINKGVAAKAQFSTFRAKLGSGFYTIKCKPRGIEAHLLTYVAVGQPKTKSSCATSLFRNRLKASSLGI